MQKATARTFRFSKGIDAILESLPKGSMTTFVEQAIHERILRDIGKAATSDPEGQRAEALRDYRTALVERNRPFILERVARIGPDLKDPSWQFWMKARGLTQEQVEGVIKEAKT